MHSHWRNWVHFDHDQVNNTANEPCMTQFGHFSAKVYSILDPNSVVYLPPPPPLSQTELLNVNLFFCVLIGYLGGQHGPILSVRDFPSRSGEKRQKRSETSASKASPAVDLGGKTALFPPSPRALLADFCFVFPPLWTWSQARISCVGPVKTRSLFGHIINPSLSSLFGQDSWTLTSSVTSTSSRSLTQQKRTRRIWSHLDLRLDQLRINVRVQSSPSLGE